MIRYFRSILPSRLILLVLLYLALRLPLIFFGFPTTAPELLYMLIGERMADGFEMYHDIYDNTAPLSAMFYWLIDLVVGRSVVVYRVVATVLLLIQCLVLNSTFNRHNVYGSQNYLPALLYLLLGSITFEFDMLTPLLIGNTFVIMSLPYFLTLSREGLDSHRLFVGGFMLGLAALSYLPLALFLLMGLFAVILFASNSFRSFLLTLCGFLFPYAVLMTYYMYVGSQQFFLDLHLLRPWRFNINFLLPPDDLAILLAAPALVLLLGLLSAASLPQRLVFQVKFQQLMWVWLIVSLVVIFTREEVSAGTFVMALPAVAYFSEYIFTSSRKAWILNTLFLLIVASVVLLRYRDPLKIDGLIALEESALLLPQAPATPANATVLVLGNDRSYYIQNKLATPYLNWRLSQRHFAQLNNYEAVHAIYLNFIQEKPTYIIDKAGMMQELQYKLPGIFELYSPTATPGVFKLK
ncbi:hypothetical protein [Pontibacter harenae]|uniref:hypothetical protein n=1 Tax=Pontibacter harenae TaxID=2894083 RepID=UPI001E61F276|nr:hypothetical protein [Pontibacter harenae]MCC9165425.1 hypothetical protein [Pontibacter harenae]